MTGRKGQFIKILNKGAGFREFNFARICFIGDAFYFIQLQGFVSERSGYFVHGFFTLSHNNDVNKPVF